VLFARTPGLGGPRTRLSRELGDTEAERLAAAFFADQAMVCALWRRRSTPAEMRQVAIYVPDSTDDALLSELATLSGARVCVQSGADHGEHLRRALTDELDRGAGRVMALLGHAPTLPVHLLDEAMRALTFHDVVIGPTFQGSWWGVGLVRSADCQPPKEAALLTALFEKAPFGTAGLLHDTLERTLRMGTVPLLLPYWFDVTEPADLARLKTHLRYLELRGAAGGLFARAAISQQAPPQVTPGQREPRVSRRS
jgi:glycosyltransferase A (GT-A) superfamily protein (DUF2064 family)